MKKSEAKFDGPPDKREKAREQNHPQAARNSPQQQKGGQMGGKQQGRAGGGRAKPG
jgi:hypothetical protein